MVDARGRRYIHHEYRKHTDDTCLEYRSIPMAIAKKMLQPPPQNHDFNGVKASRTLYVSRPQNIMAMANSISNSTGQAFSEVLQHIIDEEHNDVETHMRENTGVNKEEIYGVQDNVPKKMNFSSEAKRKRSSSDDDVEHRLAHGPVGSIFPKRYMPSPPEQVEKNVNKRTVSQTDFTEYERSVKKAHSTPPPSVVQARREGLIIGHQRGQKAWATYTDN